MPTIATYLRSCSAEPEGYAHHQAVLDAWLAEHSDHQLVGAWVDAPAYSPSPPPQRSRRSARTSRAAMVVCRTVASVSAAA